MEEEASLGHNYTLSSGDGLLDTAERRLHTGNVPGWEYPQLEFTDFLGFILSCMKDLF